MTRMARIAAADAVTVHPYLGLAAMGAFVSRAHHAGSCLLVVTRSSNPEGRDVQSAVGEDGRRVDERLLYEIGRLNRSAQALFLAPGVGAQGATPEDVARVFAACPHRVMPSLSRSLLAAGPDVKSLQERAAPMAAEFRRLLPASTDATSRTI